MTGAASAAPPPFFNRARAVGAAASPPRGGRGRDAPAPRIRQIARIRLESAGERAAPRAGCFPRRAVVRLAHQMLPERAAPRAGCFPRPPPRAPPSADPHGSGAAACPAAAARLTLLTHNVCRSFISTGPNRAQ